MISIDGSLGEGGGQVLRTALALSLLSGQDFQLINIRAKRKKPGLQAQHLEAVRAATAIGKAEVEGAALGSQSLIFRPNGIHPGRYHWEIGTAGATTLVFQTVYLPLSRLGAASNLVITGGTHVPWSPCYHYLAMQWLPFMQRIGLEISLSLEQAGFYPQGGGKISAVIRPIPHILPLTLIERGALVQIRGISAVANLDRKIAERQRNRVLRRLGAKYPLNDLRIVELPSRFKGTLLLLLVEFAQSSACYFGLGEIGKPAERVADEAIDALEEFLATDGAIDQFLADQLLLPLAFAEGCSRYRTSKVTQHLLTNAEVLKAFLPVKIEVAGEMGAAGMVTING
jgi:RNA 3'-terminal phosphate cyclase (ATP)